MWQLTTHCHVRQPVWLLIFDFISTLLLASHLYPLLSTHADRHVVDISFTVCLFVFLSAGILITDISGVGRCRAMKFRRLVDLIVCQIISPFGELWPRGKPPRGQKVKNFGNAYLVDRLRDLAEILQDGRSRWIVGHLSFR